MYIQWQEKKTGEKTQLERYASFYMTRGFFRKDMFAP